MIRLPELLVIVGLVVLIGGYKAFPKIATSIKDSKKIMKDDNVEATANGTEGK